MPPVVVAHHLSARSTPPRSSRAPPHPPAFPGCAQSVAPPPPLLQFLLGMPISLVDRQRRLPQVVKLAQLVGHARKHARHRLANRVLPITDHPRHRLAQPAPPPAKSSVAADSINRASIISPLTHSRTTHSTSCTEADLSGCTVNPENTDSHLACPFFKWELSGQLLRLPILTVSSSKSSPRVLGPPKKSAKGVSDTCSHLPLIEDFPPQAVRVRISRTSKVAKA